jgi:hypothetical protein
MIIMQREYGGQHVRCDRLCRGGPLWRQLEVQGKRQRTQTYAASTLCYYLDLAHPRAVSAQMPLCLSLCLSLTLPRMSCMSCVLIGRIALVPAGSELVSCSSATSNTDQIVVRLLCSALL